jgi:outer membrane lipoprotein LolB
MMLKELLLMKPAAISIEKPFMILFIRCALILFFCVLSSCALAPPLQESPQNKAISWDSRTAELSKISTWNLTALIAIRTQTENNSASLQWQQTPSGYSLYLLGPLGTHSFKLTGNASHVTLENSQGQKSSANTPELLLAEQTGWKLPVSNLRYWIRGIPVPGIPVQKSLDAYSHLTALTQQGWRVDFLRYSAVNQVDLPTKIFITSPDLTVKIIIKHWEYARN